MTPLEALGWRPFFAEAFAPFAAQGWAPARVYLEHKRFHRVVSETGERVATLAGRLRHEARSREELPAVGDWVAVQALPRERSAVIHAVLPRRTRFLRRAAGPHAEAQVVAANLDTVFLVTGLDDNFNPRRVERYLVVAWESGANPVVVLNKADLREDAAECVREIEAVAPGVPVHAVSALDDDGWSALRPYLVPGETVGFLGSSGVGKSTLINRLAGAERLPTNEVRASDSRGRHTTTQRELLVLPGGALVIDTPGMRELQLWDAGASLADAFEDVATIADRCRFRDCQHVQEPGCAVRRAVEEGTLPPERFENLLKMRKELERLEVRDDLRLQALDNRRVRSLHRLAKKHRPKG